MYAGGKLASMEEDGSTSTFMEVSRCVHGRICRRSRTHNQKSSRLKA